MLIAITRTSGYTVGITLHSATLGFDGNCLSLAKIFKRQQLVASQVRCLSRYRLGLEVRTRGIGFLCLCF